MDARGAQNWPHAYAQRQQQGQRGDRTQRDADKDEAIRLGDWEQPLGASVFTRKSAMARPIAGHGRPTVVEAGCCFSLPFA
jgi:hypothetical protein